MTRRLNGQGSVQKLENGSWRGRVSIGKDKSGKYVRKNITANTRKELLKKMDEIKSMHLHGDKLREVVTVGNWLNRWMIDYKSLSLKPRTYDTYESQIRTNIKPHIGDILMTELTHSDLQRFYQQLYDNGNGLSSATIRKIHHILHSAFDKAILNDIVHRNVAKGIDLPRMNNVLVKSFTVDEQNRFFEAARDSRLYNAFLISVDTGLRTGELLALEWGDIDFAQKYISVTKGLAVVNDRSPDRKTKTITIVQDSPKTETSVRLVPLTNRCYKILLDMYKNRTCNIVFPSENNTHIGPRNYIRTFHKILAKAGLSKCGPHVLRHTFVTRCFENDVSSKVISELVGHAKLSHTMDIYTHVAFRIKRDAVEALNNLYDYQMRMEKRGDQLG